MGLHYSTLILSDINIEFHIIFVSKLEHCFLKKNSANHSSSGSHKIWIILRLTNIFVAEIKSWMCSLHEIKPQCLESSIWDNLVLHFTLMWHVQGCFCDVLHGVLVAFCPKNKTRKPVPYRKCWAGFPSLGAPHLRITKQLCDLNKIIFSCPYYALL